MRASYDERGPRAAVNEFLRKKTKDENWNEVIEKLQAEISGFELRIETLEQIYKQQKKDTNKLIKLLKELWQYIQHKRSSRN